VRRQVTEAHPDERSPPMDSVGPLKGISTRGGGGGLKMSDDPMDAVKGLQPPQFQNARLCGARTKSGKPCRSPATKKGRCRLHGGARGSGGPLGERSGQFRHGERTKAAMAERGRFEIPHRNSLLPYLRCAIYSTRSRRPPEQSIAGTSKTIRGQPRSGSRQSCSAERSTQY
jgi:hypothetical protein